MELTNNLSAIDRKVVLRLCYYKRHRDVHDTEIQIKHLDAWPKKNISLNELKEQLKGVVILDKFDKKEHIKYKVGLFEKLNRLDYEGKFKPVNNNNPLEGEGWVFKEHIEGFKRSSAPYGAASSHASRHLNKPYIEQAKFKYKIKDYNKWISKSIAVYRIKTDQQTKSMLMGEFMVNVLFWSSDYTADNFSPLMSEIAATNIHNQLAFAELLEQGFTSTSNATKKQLEELSTIISNNRRSEGFIRTLDTFKSNKTHKSVAFINKTFKLVSGPYLALTAEMVNRIGFGMKRLKIKKHIDALFK